MRNLLIALATILTFSSAVFAEIKIDRVGGNLGLLSPDTIDTTIAFGAELPLGPVHEKIHVGSTLDLWFSSIGALDFSDIILGGYGRYQEKVVIGDNLPLDLYGGAGLDIHLYSYDYTISSVSKSDSSLEFGFSFFGGGIYKLKSNLDLMSEVRFRTNVDQLHIKIGAIYHF